MPRARYGDPMSVPVILDVDTGVDDALAIMFAVRHPGLDLLGISCVAGNAPLAQVVDNTLRIQRVVPADWVLLDIAVHGVHRGFGHGRVHQYDREGVLLATASQTAIVRDVAG